MHPAYPWANAAGLQRLVTLLPVAAFLTRGNRISFVNPAAQRLFNASEQDLKGHSPLEFLDPQALSVARQDRTGPHGQDAVHKQGEEVVLSAEGSVRLVHTSAVCLDDQEPATMLVLMHDVTALKQSQTELTHSQSELRRMAARVARSQEAERTRLASELHDELRQTLAAIHMELGALGAQLSGQDDPAVARLAYVSRLALNAMESAGRIVNDLRPPILEELGLAAALEALVAQVAERSALRCRFVARIDARAGVLSRPMVASTLFRVARDMLDAVTGPPRIGSVDVQLLPAPNAGVQLRVSRNGYAGTALRSRSWRERVSSMRERLRAVGGEITLSSGSDSHTLDATVSLAPPLARAAQGMASLDRTDDLYAMLLRFLYRAPVGLVQTTLEGRIEMLNPKAAQLLLPFAPEGHLVNLLSLLASAAPQLARQVNSVSQPSGLVCDAMPIELLTREPAGASHRFTLSLLKQDGVRLMAVLS